MEMKIRNDLENIQKLLIAQRCEILAQKTEIAELTAKLTFHHQEEHSLFEGLFLYLYIFFSFIDRVFIRFSFSSFFLSFFLFFSFLFFIYLCFYLT